MPAGLGAGTGAATVVGAGTGALGWEAAGTGALAGALGWEAAGTGALAGALAGALGWEAAGTGALAGADGVEVDGARVAACACRENTSKTTRIPAATIASCTARRAMYRKIGCGMSSSRPTGTDRTRLLVPAISDPKRAGHILFQALFCLGHPEPDILRSVRKRTYCSATTVQSRPGPGKGRGWRLSSTANSGT